MRDQQDKERIVPKPGPKGGDSLAGGVVLCLGMITIWRALGVSDEFASDHLGGGFVPLVLGVLLTLSGSTLLGKQWLIAGGKLADERLPISNRVDETHRVTRQEAPSSSSDEGPEVGVGRGGRRVIVAIGVMCAYAVLMNVVGYVLSTIPALAAMIALGGERRPSHALGGSLVLTVVIYLLFVMLIGINVPEGILLVR